MVTVGVGDAAGATLTEAIRSWRANSYLTARSYSASRLGTRPHGSLTRWPLR